MEQIEFDRSYFDRLEAARNHWWVQGMREIGAVMLGGPLAGLDVLDAGCGTGALLPWLAEAAAPGRLHAVDFAPGAMQACRRLEIPLDLAQASVTHLPFKDERFDLVVSMDVLQHVTAEQEEAALEETARVLRPGGRVLIRTNAAFGRSRVRERNDWRLYRPATLRAALEGAGLEVLTLTPVNFLQGLWASVPRLRRTDGHNEGHAAEDHVGLGIPTPVHPLKNRALLGSLRAEAWWLSRPGRRLPYGHSLYAVAMRPS